MYNHAHHASRIYMHHVHEPAHQLQQRPRRVALVAHSQVTGLSGGVEAWRKWAASAVKVRERKYGHSVVIDTEGSEPLAGKAGPAVAVVDGCDYTHEEEVMGATERLVGVVCEMLHVARRTSHVTRHTSHVTRHTSHVTRHTSHVTRHTPTTPEYHPRPPQYPSQAAQACVSPPTHAATNRTCNRIIKTGTIIINNECGL